MRYDQPPMGFSRRVLLAKMLAMQGVPVFLATPAMVGGGDAIEVRGTMDVSSAADADTAVLNPPRIANAECMPR